MTSWGKRVLPSSPTIAHPYFVRKNPGLSDCPCEFTIPNSGGELLGTAPPLSSQTCPSAHRSSSAFRGKTAWPTLVWVEFLCWWLWTHVLMGTKYLGSWVSTRVARCWPSRRSYLLYPRARSLTAHVEHKIYFIYCRKIRKYAYVTTVHRWIFEFSYSLCI